MNDDYRDLTLEDLEVEELGREGVTWRDICACGLDEEDHEWAEDCMEYNFAYSISSNQEIAYG